MASEETNISQEIKLAGAQTKTKLFRNSRGLFYTLDTVPKLMAAFARGGMVAAKALVGALRKTKAGLEFKGSSDLLGWTEIIVTPEMVGQKIAVFTAVEAKTESGVESDDQANWGRIVTESGGIYVLARNPQDFLNGVRNFFKKLGLTK